eukprot:scaffold38265_cov221-Amphora_coffeaeformis.AAC.1
MVPYAFGESATTTAVTFVMTTMCARMTGSLIARKRAVSILLFAPALVMIILTVQRTVASRTTMDGLTVHLFPSTADAPPDSIASLGMAVIRVTMVLNALMTFWILSWVVHLSPSTADALLDNIASPGMAVFRVTTVLNALTIFSILSLVVHLSPSTADAPMEDFASLAMAALKEKSMVDTSLRVHRKHLATTVSAWDGTSVKMPPLALCTPVRQWDSQKLCHWELTFPARHSTIATC